MLSKPQKEAISYVFKNLGLIFNSSLTSNVAVLKKVMAIKSENNIFKADKKINFNENALMRDTEKVKEVYNNASIAKPKGINNPEEAATSAINLKLRQKKSGFLRSMKNLDHKLSRHPIYLLMRNIIGPGLIYGSFGLLVGYFVLLAFPPAAAALGGTYLFFLTCFIGGIVVLPFLKKAVTKIFWSIYSAIKGHSSTEKTKKNLLA